MKYAKDIVLLAQTWVGKKESDGSFKFIIDLYNTYKPHPRGYKLKYTDSWCAGTMSALAIKLGFTDIIPIECSCPQMIVKAKEMGIWVESDSYVPKAGDMILYDWHDNGKGDNTGNPDHIGLVESVTSGIIVIIEGNYNNAVGRRTVKVNERFIRGYITPKYDKEMIPTKSITTVAKEVLAGKWGNGAERKRRLEEAGYNYSDVQKKVNELTSTSNKKSVTEIAKEVIEGKWGNGMKRRTNLRSAGYNPDEVQKKVNELLK